jgi:hypothetical protein
MADRFPLIVDSSNQNIKELPDGDSLLLGDNEKLRFGDGQDLDIYHSGTNSVIDNNTGGLYIRNNVAADVGGDIFIQAKSGETSATFTHDGAVTLMYDNTTRFATTSTGATTTGLHTSTQSANITEVALTNASSIVWDAAAKANATLALNADSYAGNVTFAAPGNPVAGAIISVEIAQDGTPRTVAWNTIFEFAASTAPTVTATASKTDIFAFRYNGSVWQEIGRVQNMAQT